MSRSRAPDGRQKRPTVPPASSAREKAAAKEGAEDTELPKIARGTRNAMVPLETDGDTFVVDLDEIPEHEPEELEAAEDGTVESVDETDRSDADVDERMLELGQRRFGISA